MVLRQADGTLWTADHVSVAGGGPGRIGALHADAVHAARSGDSATAATLDGRDITMPPAAPGQAAGFDAASVAFANLTAHGLALTAGGRLANADGASVDDYGAGRASTVAIEGFSAPIPASAYADHAGFSRFRLSGIDLASLADALVRRTDVAKPTVGRVDLQLDGVLVGQGGSPILRLARAVVASASGEGLAVSTATADVSGFSLTPVDASSRASLQTIGLDAIRGGLSLASSYATAGGVLQVAPLTMQVDGLGSLEVAVKLARVDAPGTTRGASVWEAAGIRQDGQLASASLLFRDAGLRDRLLALGARRTGLTPDQLAGQAVERIGSDPTFSLIPGGGQARQALASFVSAGGMLRVALNPPSPIALSEVLRTSRRDPVSLVASLGLAVSGGPQTKPGTAGN